MNFFPKDSYLGVLRLFLWVLEVARSRRLGIAGEVSVWQIPENGVCTSPCQHGAGFFFFFFFRQKFFRQDFGRGGFLWEKRVMTDLPIRSHWTGTNDLRDHDDDEIADTNWSLRDSRGGDIAFVSFQMQGKFRRRCSGSKWFSSDNLSVSSGGIAVVQLWWKALQCGGNMHGSVHGSVSVCGASAQRDDLLLQFSMMSLPFR